MYVRFSSRLASICCLALCVRSSAAQSQAIDGNIAGYVTSQDGQALGGAHVRVTNTATGFTREGDANSSGYYSVQLLPPGNYTLTVSRDNFSTVVRNGLTLTVGEVERVDVQLKVGNVSTMVEVNDQPPAVAVERTAGYSGLFTERDARNVALSSRNPLEFFIFSPIVNSQRVSNGGSGTSTPSVLYAGIGGLEFNVDGVSNNVMGGARNVVMSGEAVSEYQTLINFSAEFGRMAGPILNAVSRSGSNQWHGSAYMFTKQKVLSARPYLLSPTTPTPDFSRYNWGGTLAGPIVKDKAFFFFSYERWIQDNPVVSTFGGAQQAVIAQQIGLGADELPVWNNTFRAHTITAKTDIVLNNRNRLGLRYNMFLDHEAGTDSGTVTRSEAPGFNDEPHSGTAQLVTTLSPSLLNEFRFLYAIRPVQKPTIHPNNPAISLSGIGTFNGNASGNYWYRESGFQVVDNVSWNKGRHSFKAGFDILPANFQDTTTNWNGTFAFNGLAASSARGAVTPVQQYVNTVAKTIDPATNAPYTYTQFTQSTGALLFDATVFQQGYFVQDDFRITPRLKANLGIRYDANLRPSGNLNPAYPQTGKIPQQYNEVGPRIGVAWDPFGKAKSVIRFGYGIYYNQNSAQDYETWERQNGITVKSLTVLPTQTGAPAFTLGQVSSVTGGTAAVPNVYQVDSNRKDLMMQSWNVTGEHEILPGYTFGISYFGAHINHLGSYARPGNLTAIGSLADGRVLFSGSTNRPDPKIGTLYTVSSTGTWQVYNALLVTLNRQLSHGLHFQAGYQRQKITTCADKATVMIDNRCFNQGRSSSDQPNRFTLTGVWEPQVNLTNRAMSHLLNGWLLSNTSMVQTGFPYESLTGQDTNGDTSTNDRIVGGTYNANRLPLYVQVDFRLSRSIKFGERGKLELFGEALNATDNANIYGANGTFGPNATPSASFGTPTSAEIARQFQLGFRYAF